MRFSFSVRFLSFANAPRAWRLPLAAAALATLTACGGGDQVKQFVPTRLVAFGDESSALASAAVVVTADDVGSPAVATDGARVQGLKYNINSLLLATPLVRGLAAGDVVNYTQLAADYGAFPSGTGVATIVVPATGQAVLRRVFAQTVRYTPAGQSTETSGDFNVQYDYVHECSANRTWVQLVANSYGLGFKGQGCDLDGATGARSHAAAQARVSDVLAQMEAHRAELNSSTLVTVLAGQNDLLAYYDAVRGGALSADAARTASAVVGRQLALGINGLLGTGARVLVVNLPVLGQSPVALAGDPALMNSLVLAFNQGLTGVGGLQNDGTRIGLVKFYEDSRLVLANASSLNSSGFVDGTTPACKTSLTGPDGVAYTSPGAPLFGGDALQQCNAYTLVPGATPFNHFWADSAHFSAGVHARLANLAFARAQANPF